MTYSIYECCKTFNIKDIDNCSVATMKKIYHKLILKYHPDKGHQQCHDHFLKIKDCYEILLKYKEEETKHTNVEKNIYEYFLSVFTISNLEKIIDWVDTQKKHQITHLHISWDQVVSKDLYLYKSKYIPLWYNTIILDEELIYIQVKNMPSYIKRNENNDLIVCYTQDIALHQTVSISICEHKTVYFEITPKIMDNKYYIALHNGIPRMCEENIYDISELSHIIVLFQ